MAVELKCSNTQNNNRAGQLAHKNESDMKEQIFNIVTLVGLVGLAIHPISLAFLAVGAWGINRYGKSNNNDRA